MGQNLDLILLFITIELGLELFFLQVELKGRPSTIMFGLVQVQRMVWQ